ncbi:achaete-scute homolog 5-like [Melanotaenia boesemani]|uniref:achaete-scute homolog 5-like n=1 Tax=Melanotaenia boesemani TaxID=1250792 RepID=UPI001C0513CC|nr:achaete-scute homolog 5-like [Melanotaenia boesemani]
MSSTFSHSLLVSPPAGLCEDHSSSQASDSYSGPAPFLFYPPNMDPTHLGFYRSHLRAHSRQGLLPYLAPFHHHGPFSVYECPFEPAFIQKRNERERQRVKCVNQGYAKLRDHLPGHSADKRLSKVETLRAAIRYIKYLQGLVEPEDGVHSETKSPEIRSPGPNCGGEAFVCQHSATGCT